MRDRASTQDLITPCVSLLNRLSLHQVRDDWVDNVWDGQFTESQELPPDYEELIHGVEVGEIFSRLTDLISRWIKTHGSSSVSEDESMNSTNQSLDLYTFLKKLNHNERLSTTSRHLRLKNSLILSRLVRKYNAMR